MHNHQALIEEVYAAFNRRDIDAVFAHMSPDVDWPKASEGGRVIGKDEIRAYWTRQWAQFDPHVYPLEVTTADDGRTNVKVHQVVKSLNGDPLFDGTLLHIYTISNGLIQRMDIAESQPAFPHPHNP